VVIYVKNHVITGISMTENFSKRLLDNNIGDLIMLMKYFNINNYVCKTSKCLYYFDNFFKLVKLVIGSATHENSGFIACIGIFQQKFW